MTNDYTPKGYQSVTPHFVVKDAPKMVDFLKDVFEAELVNQALDESGFIQHAEIRIGNTMIELAEGNDRYPPRSNTIHIFVADTDDCYAKAMKAGSKSLYEPANMSYGDRSGGIEDPFGNHWYLATFDRKKHDGYYG